MMDIVHELILSVCQEQLSDFHRRQAENFDSRTQQSVVLKLLIHNLGSEQDSNLFSID